MLEFNQKNIFLLESLIYDSQLKFKDIHLSDNQVKINIFRPDYKRQYSKGFLFFRKVYVKGIYSEININDILNYTLIWKDISYNKPDDIHTILTIIYDSEFIQFETEWLILKVYFNYKYKIELNDIQESEEIYLRVIGKEAFNYDKWLEKYMELK